VKIHDIQDLGKLLLTYRHGVVLVEAAHLCRKRWISSERKHR
jgi:hypothetical protein